MADIHFKLTADDSDVVKKITELQNKVADTNSKLSKIDLSQADSAIADMTARVKEQESAVAELTAQYKELKKQKDILSSNANYKAESEINKQLNALKPQLEQEKQVLNSLNQELNNAKAVRGQIASVIKEQKQVTKEHNEVLKQEANAQKEVSKQTKDVERALSQVNPALGGFINGLKKVIMAAEAFIATPLGLVLGALGLALSAVKVYFTETAEGEMEFARISGYTKTVVNELKSEVAGLGKSLVNLFKDPKQELENLWNKIQEFSNNVYNARTKYFANVARFFSSLFKGDWEGAKDAWKGSLENVADMVTGHDDIIKKSQEAAKAIEEEAKAMAHLKEAEKNALVKGGEWNKRAAELEAIKNEARGKLYNTNLDDEERKEAVDIIKAAVLEWEKGEKVIIQAQIDRKKEYMKLFPKLVTKEDERQLLDLEAQYIRIGAQAKGELASLVRRTKKLYKEDDTEAKEFQQQVDALLKHYREYNKTRLDIEQEYEQKSNILKAQRLKAEIEMDKEAAKEADQALNKLYLEKSKTLLKYDFDQLKKDPEYIQAFENLKYASEEVLKSLIEKFEDAKQIAAETLDPTELQAYTDAIEKMRNEIAERNPFEALKAANDELKDAIEKGDRQEISKAQEKYNKALKTSIERVNTLISAVNELGDTIGGQAGEIINLIADFGSFITTSIEGMKAVAQTGAQAISSVEKASIILTVIAGAVKVFNSFANARDQYIEESIQRERELEIYERDLELLAAKINKDYDTIFGTNVTRKIANVKQALEGMFKTLTEFYNSHQTEKNSLFYSADLDAVNKMVMSVSQLEDEIERLQLQLDNGDYYDTWGNNLKNALEDEIEYLKKLKEIREEADNVVSTYVDGIADDITDVIWNAVENGTDAWTDFEKTGKEAIAAIGKNMLKSVIMSDWLENWKSRISSVIFSQDQQKIQEAFNSMYAEGASMMEDWERYAKMWQDAIGVTSDTYSQEASTGAWQSMSQETADELNGRFTALQISNEQISMTASQGLELMRSIAMVATQSNAILSDILVQSGRANSFLEDISKYTKQCAGFANSIEKIEKNTQSL